MQKRSRSWRTVEVEGVSYRWRYGLGTIEVRRDRQVVLRVAAYVLRGTTPNLFERGQYKGTCDGYVTPAMVRNAIAKTLGARERSSPKRASSGTTSACSSASGSCRRTPSRAHAELRRKP